MNCQSCENHLEENYTHCPYCGQPTELERIDGKYVTSEISSVLNFDKGISFTIRELLLRPGKTVKNFIETDRNRLVKPIIFIVLCSLIYMIAQQIFHFEDGYVNYSGLSDSATSKIFEWVQNNYGYANILMSFFIVFWIKVLFRKQEYNFFEVLILLCFIMGMGMLFYTISGVVEAITKLRILHFGGVVGMIYSSWAIGQFFNKKKFPSYLKAFFAYLLGMFSFTLCAILLGVLIDFLV